MKKLFPICLALALNSHAAHATVILQDSFSYANGSLITNSSFFWNTHSGTTGQTQVVSGKVQLSQSQSEDVSALLTNQPYTSGSGTILYAGFTVNFSALPTQGGSYFAHFKDSGFGYRARVWTSTSNAPTGFFRLGIGNSSGATNTSGQLATNLSLNTTYTVVARYDVATALSTIWLNPSAESDPSVTASDSSSTMTVTSFAFRQHTGMGTLVVDDLRVGTSFADVVPAATNQPPAILTQPQSQTVAEGAAVSFTVVAGGSPTLNYQWQFNGTNLVGETNESLTFASVTTNQAGTYRVSVTNAFGSTNSQPATLTVNVLPPPYQPGALSVITYNVKGNGVSDWSTNSLQVQAIGRQMSYLNPDIIAFQEIPFDLSYEMTNFVNVYLPGYALARNSGTDGYVRSMIASRFAITRSQKWLDGVSLTNFGYSGTFTRDLFEAQISVAGFPQPLHVFTTHLKAGVDADSAARRAAEASAISNYFVTGYLTTNALRPYLLAGDLNEDLNRPSSTNQPVQRMTNGGTGLRLTTPRNPFNNDDRTWSIQAANPSVRYDYILPCGLLFSNINSSQVFRTDLLSPTPPALQQFDDKTASDHLPVLMVFDSPYDKPFRLTSISLSNAVVTLRWESVLGQPYRVDASSNLTVWTALVSNLVATGSSFTFTTNLTGPLRFFRVYRVP